jgi:hypothetical protein
MSQSNQGKEAQQCPCQNVYAPGTVLGNLTVQPNGTATDPQHNIWFPDPNSPGNWLPQVFPKTVFVGQPIMENCCCCK